MPLTTPSLATVTPGEPVTAQGWNALVTGLTGLYQAVIALGGGSLEIIVTTPGAADGDPAIPVPTAAVIAEPLGDGRPSHALPPFGTRTAHLLVGLTDGSWRVHIEAAGFNPEVRDITLPHPDPLAVTLTRSGPVVPALFGVSLRGALDRLRGLGIEVASLLDTTGREVSQFSVPPEYVDAPILAQLPPAGTVLATADRVSLVVASALRRDPVVTMPSLVGLTLAEAQQVLERLGLQMGTSQIRDVRVE